jgi:hypothetical protein
MVSSLVGSLVCGARVRATAVGFIDIRQANTRLISVIDPGQVIAGRSDPFCFRMPS